VRIAFRPSGGRGEYELAGEYGGVAASDLFGRRLVFQITPELTIDGRQRVLRVQGKPRIRLAEGESGRHASGMLAGVLLLPVPRRELGRTTSGPDFVRDGGYVVGAIDVDLVAFNGQAELRPVRLYLINEDSAPRSIDFPERMGAILSIWAAARDRDERLAALVRSHEAAVASGNHSAIGTAASAIRRVFGTGTDVLPLVAAALGVGLEDVIGEGGVVVDEVPDEGAEETDPAEAIREALSRWRRQAIRDAAGRRFAEGVKAAYDFRCVVSSHRYPKLDSAVSAGVDGAHILPYRRYDLNEVTNGLCLCKMCHWAFDSGVIRIDYRRTARRYVVRVPPQTRAEARANSFDLSFFEQYEGPIARPLLPQSEALWPSPRYLEELNGQLFA
jgi:hypothetical protein